MGRDKNMMYLRFIICLSVGLLGLGMFLKALFDGPLYDWDLVADFKKMASDISRKRRYVQIDMAPNENSVRLASAVVAERRRIARTRDLLPSDISATPSNIAPRHPADLIPTLN